MTPANPNGRQYSFAALCADIDADIFTYQSYAAAFMEKRVSLLRKISVMLTPALMAMTIHRFSHWLYCRGNLRLAFAASNFNYWLHKISITPRSQIGPGAYVAHPFGAIFDGIAGSGLVLYPFCSVSRFKVGNPQTFADTISPRVGDNVTIGTYSILFGDIDIGSGVAIAPEVVLTKSVPVNGVVLSREKTQKTAVAD